jgi:hypothetical protein
VPGYQEQVRWLHVEVLEPILRGNHIQRFSRICEVGKEFIAGNARQTTSAALAESILKLAVGKLHHHDQFASNNLDPLQSEKKWVANCFDLLECVEFLREAPFTLTVIGRRTAHELDGLEKPAGCLTAPNFAKAPASERVQ